MPKHVARWEVVHTGPARFHIRFIGGNGEPVVAGESLKRKRSAYHAVEAVTGESLVWDAYDHARVMRAAVLIEVRFVDERDLTFAKVLSGATAKS